MRKLSRFASGALAAAVIAGSLGLGVGLDAKDAAAAQTCFIVYPDNWGHFPGQTAVGVVRSVVETADSITMTCTAQGHNPFRRPARGWGLLCGLPGPGGVGTVVTDDSMVMVTADGNGKLVCTYKKSIGFGSTATAGAATVGIR